MTIQMLRAAIGDGVSTISELNIWLKLNQKEGSNNEQNNIRGNKKISR